MGVANGDELVILRDIFPLQEWGREVWENEGGVGAAFAVAPSQDVRFWQSSKILQGRILVNMHEYHDFFVRGKKIFDKCALIFVHTQLFYKYVLKNVAIYDRIS